MSNNITGDVKVFNSSQLKVIQDVLVKLGFQKKEVVIETLGKPGDNFASEVKVIKVNINRDEVFRIIIKRASMFTGPENPLSDFTCVIFNNEITMYAEVLQMMTQLQINANVKQESMFNYANYYGALRAKGQEIILIEDISKQNYVMLDKLEPLSNETIKVILDNLATFHSLSYVLKDKHPETYNEFCEKLTDFQTIDIYKHNSQSFSGLGDNFSNLFSNNKYKQIVKQIFQEQYNRQMKLAATDKGSKYAVIIHGDCWTNNMLFQLKDGVPAKCVLIDYQLSRESLPVSDILYMIFNCTDYKTRSQYYNDWIDYYHTKLEENLFDFGLKTNNVYPRDKFDTDLRRYSKALLGMVMITTGILLRESSESAKVKDGFSDANHPDDMLQAIKISDDLNKSTIFKIKERLEGLIESGIEFGYISYN